MTFSYTQVSQYLRCPGATAIGIWMVGGRRSLGQLYALAAVLK